MIKVLRVINRLNLGGPTYNASYLSKHLGEDYETLLVAGEKEDSEGSSMHIVNSLGLKPVIIPEMKRSVHLFYDLIALIKLIRLIIRFRPDVVHTHAAKAGTIGRIAAWLCGVNQIYHTFHGHVFHSYFSKNKTQFYIIIERLLARLCTNIIAISNLQKTELSAKYKICSADKIVVIPLGFDLKRFQENEEEKRKKFRKHNKLKITDIAIGIVGRLVPIKNHFFFIDLVHRLEQTSSFSYQYFIIGDGELRDKLMEYCNKKDIPYSYKIKQNENEKLCFTSWIEEMDWVYAGLDIVCLTSDNEGTPVSLIEAQAAGKPIVSTDVGGVKDINFSKDCFHIHPKSDYNGFLNSIEAISKSLTLNKPIPIEHVEDVVNMFSYKRLCSDIRRLYGLKGQK